MYNVQALTYYVCVMSFFYCLFLNLFLCFLFLFMLHLTFLFVLPFTLSVWFDVLHLSVVLPFTFFVSVTYYIFRLCNLFCIVVRLFYVFDKVYVFTLWYVLYLLFLWSLSPVFSQTFLKISIFQVYLDQLIDIHFYLRDAKQILSTSTSQVFILFQFFKYLLTAGLSFHLFILSRMSHWLIQWLIQWLIH